MQNFIKENLIHAFTVNPLTNNAHEKILLTQTNTASKSCRFILMCKTLREQLYDLQGSFKTEICN